MSAPLSPSEYRQKFTRVEVCYGKYRYETKKDAQVAKSRLAKKYQQQHRYTRPLQVFYCAGCGGFHLGRPPKKTLSPKRLLAFQPPEISDE